MSTQTTNLNLVKPGDNDALDIADINDNMDTLDAAVGAVDVQTDGSLQEQINDLGESVSLLVGTASELGVTITPKTSDGYSIQNASGRRFGRVVVIAMTLIKSVEWPAGASYDPFTTNIQHGVVSGDNISGFLTSSGKAWIKSNVKFAANTPVSVAFIGIL